MRKIALSLLLALQCLFLCSQTPSESLFSALQWRMIGPHRGGRTVGGCGIAGQPNVFYIGVNNGGVWKTTDYGWTWKPIFDDQPTGSVGDVAVAPSNPDVVYVASGEGIQRPDLSVGDGIYKSSDAGKTWTHLGLTDGQQIGGLAVDPANENRVFAAVLGHPYGPNKERGVFRSLDGGKTWQNVLFKDENTGAIQVTIDPNNPNIVYADLLESRQAPWENGEWQGPGSGLFKSVDGGNTWTQLTNGLPTAQQGLARIGFCIARSNSNRLYATVDAREKGGIYRSDDAGASWKLLNSDERLHDRRDDFGEIQADPKNPDIVYTACEVTWKSTNGGKNWSAFKGAPGGDDYHRLWINPLNPEVILLTSDQGAVVTVNGGQTWSSWYNQPTAQLYHVSADNAFPYNVYSGQQESGSVGIASRGNDGQIGYREWHPVGAQEYGYVVADPLDPNIIYGGKLSRFDKRTGQTQYIAPESGRGGPYRFLRTAPVMFSPTDPHTLYYAGNVLFKTRDGGHSWTQISDDLTLDTRNIIPASVGNYPTPEQREGAMKRSVIYALAPSPVDSNTIWAGTDNGFLSLTRDGGRKWNRIALDQVPPWSKIAQIEASHTDPKKAWIAVNRLRCDDLHPLILRTRDAGKSWQTIVQGIPDEPINTVREDPVRKGLLFAGSEHAVYVSFDDGDHWQSLRRNMPATSIRDLIIKDDDIVVATHGRSFWILDNISVLRQLSAETAARDAILFQPQTAWRVRWDTYTDTPVPPEEPAGQNPPDGAAIDFYLKDQAKGVVTLDIKDGKGQLVRHYASNAVRRDIPEINNLPEHWVRPEQILPDTAGMHRFMWDLHYDPLTQVSLSYPIAAVNGQTAPNPTSPWVMPGTYQVVLTVNGKTYTQPLTVRMDPRVKTSAADLQTQHDLALICTAGRKKAMEALDEIRSLRAQIGERMEGAKGDLSKALRNLDERAESLARNPKGGTSPVFSTLNGQFAGAFEALEDCDMPPTAQTIRTVEQANKALQELLPQWTELKTKEIPSLNKLLLELQTSGPVGFLDARPAGNGHLSSEQLFSTDLSDATFPPGIWSIQNGELTATEDECIWTKKQYMNFILDLDFKTASGTNSGVIVHCTDTQNWIPNSVEIQIADDFHPEWANAPSTWQCGAIFGHLAAREHQVRRPGEWNHYTITCMDRKIWVTLNGVLVNAMDMSRWTSAARNPDGTGIPPWLSKPFAHLPLPGHIGLQGKHAGAPIWFKNVKIQELN